MKTSKETRAPYRAPAILERAIQHFAPPFRAVANLPGPGRVIRDSDGTYVVSTDFSADTIYSSPEINRAFRAWHDATHYRGGFGFDREDERAVATFQLSALHGFLKSAEAYAMPYSARTRVKQREALIALWCDTEGQQAHFARFGHFPENQSAFVGALVDTVLSTGATFHGV